MALAQQLRLREDHLYMSMYFYKLALSKVVTRGGRTYLRLRPISSQA